MGEEAAASLQFPVSKKRQWKVAVVIDVVMQILFIAPVCISSCPSSFSLPSPSHITLLHFSHHMLYHAVLTLCWPRPWSCNPTHSGLVSVCSLQTQAQTLPWPWLHCSSDRVKIGRLTRPREKVMGLGLWWTVCVVVGRVICPRLYMLCLAVPFGHWWRLRMASFAAETIYRSQSDWWNQGRGWWNMLLRNLLSSVCKETFYL